MGSMAMRIRVVLPLFMSLVALPCSAAPTKKKARFNEARVARERRRLGEASDLAVKQMQIDYKLDVYRTTKPTLFMVYDDAPNFYKITFLPAIPTSKPRPPGRRGYLGYGFGVAYFISKKNMKIRKIMRSGKPSVPFASKTTVTTEWK
jgi:hypothetical protein